MYGAFIAMIKQLASETGLFFGKPEPDAKISDAGEVDRSVRQRHCEQFPQTRFDQMNVLDPLRPAKRIQIIGAHIAACHAADGHIVRTARVGPDTT